MHCRGCHRCAARTFRSGATAKDAVLPPRCRNAAKLAATATLPPPPPPPPPPLPRCCRRRRRAAAAAATALPSPLPCCRCCSCAATAAAALPPCCLPQLYCSQRRHGRRRTATATLALPMPPPRCPLSSCCCCGRCIVVALPSCRQLPLPLHCPCAVHRHRCWLIVVFYPDAHCSHDEKRWLWSRSDPAILLPAAVGKMRVPLRHLSSTSLL
jgi:hypothetical protein